MSKLDFIIYPIIALIFIFIAAAYFGRGFLLGDISGDTDSDEFETILRNVSCDEGAESDQGRVVITDAVSRNAESLSVLVYHGIAVEYPVRKDDIHICNFRNHMHALKLAGYQTIDIQDFFEFVKGEKQLPDRSFLLSFDDGQRTSYYLSDPTLEELNYNAVMFIITKHSLGEGSSYYLSFDEITELMDSGRWEVQSHGKDSHEYVKIGINGEEGHYLSNRLWLEAEGRLETIDEFRVRIREDFRASRDDIKSELDIDVIAFAFPFGDFGQGSLNIPDAEDYIRDEVKSIYSLGNFFQVLPAQGYTQNYPDDRSFMIKRIKVPTDGSGDDLIRILENGRQKPLPYRDDFSLDRGWTRIWGEITLSNGMTIQPSEGSLGSAVFLDGSFLWKDYTVEADIKSLEVRNVGIISRYNNKENHLVCGFGSRWVTIEQRIEGEIKTLEKERHYSNLVAPDLTIGMTMKGNKSSCNLNGTMIVETDDASPELSTGGIGLKMFDPNGNDSSIVIGSIRVE